MEYPPPSRDRPRNRRADPISRLLLLGKRRLGSMLIDLHSVAPAEHQPAIERELGVLRQAAQRHLARLDTGERELGL